jgi:hypothetical protein
LRPFEGAQSPCHQGGDPVQANPAAPNDGDAGICMRDHRYGLSVLPALMVPRFGISAAAERGYEKSRVLIGFKSCSQAGLIHDAGPVDKFPHQCQNARGSLPACQLYWTRAARGWLGDSWTSTKYAPRGLKPATGEAGYRDYLTIFNSCSPSKTVYGSISAGRRLSSEESSLQRQTVDLPWCQLALKAFRDCYGLSCRSQTSLKAALPARGRDSAPRQCYRHSPWI